MAMEYGFFNSISGDRKKDADFFGEYFASFIGNGVFPNPSNNFQVFANNDMTITVNKGKAWINGVFAKDKFNTTLTIDNADGVLNRIDRIVLRLDVLAREIQLVVKKGVFASSPTARNLQRDADAYELAIADVYVGAGVVGITQANITDTRLNNALCGVVTGVIDQVDVTTLYNQYTQGFADKEQKFEQAFNTWFASIQDILDENVAGNLYNLIDSLVKVYNGKVEPLEIKAGDLWLRELGV